MFGFDVELNKRQGREDGKFARILARYTGSRVFLVSLNEVSIGFRILNTDGKIMGGRCQPEASAIFLALGTRRSVLFAMDRREILRGSSTLPPATPFSLPLLEFFPLRFGRGR